MNFAKGLAQLQKSASRSRNNPNANTNSTSRDRNNQSYHPYDSRHSRYNRHNSNNNHHRYRHGYNQAGEAEQEEQDNLRQLVKAIPRYQPVVVSKNNAPRKRRHVALLFLTIDDLPLEHLWRAFLSTAKSSKDSDLVISVLCHAKFPDKVQSPWLRQRLLIHKPSLKELIMYKKRYDNAHLRSTVTSVDMDSDTHRYGDRGDDEDTNRSGGADGSAPLSSGIQPPPVRYFSRRPEWGSVEITRAMMDLMEEALKIGTNKDSITTNVFNLETAVLRNDDASDSKSGLRPGSSGSQGQKVRWKSEEERNVYINTYTSHRYVASNENADELSSCDTSLSSSSLPTVDRFIFLSETCLPVATLEELERSLFGPQDNDNEKEAGSSSKSPGIATGKTGTYTQQHANQSWVNARNTPNNGFARQLQWDAIYPRDAFVGKVWKADQWICLTRKHAWPILTLVDEAAQEILKTKTNVNAASGRDGYGHRDAREGRNGHGHGYNRDDRRGGRGRYNGNGIGGSGGSRHLALWQSFRRVKASDEMYFPTVMSLLGILSSDETPDDDGNNLSNVKGVGDTVNQHRTAIIGGVEDEVARKRITYCDWSMNAKNPASFDITRTDGFKELKRVVRLAREEGCLFARKFTLEKQENIVDGVITAEEWLELLNKLSS